MDRIVHATAVDIGGGRRGFRSKDTVAGVPGTVVTATHLNAQQEELMAVVEKAGRAANGALLVQLVEAIRSQAFNLRPVGGAANAMTTTLDPAPASWADLLWMPFRFVVIGNNTGGATLAPNGLAAKNIVYPGTGGALLPGELLTGAIRTGMYDGANVQLIDAQPSARHGVSWRGSVAFYASGTFNPATYGIAATDKIRIRAWGAGGGGASSVGGYGASGSGGGYSEKITSISTAQTVTIGAGGLGNAGGGNGGSGGTTSFGSIISATGGGGGQSGVVGGGGGSGGDINMGGGFGGDITVDVSHAAGGAAPFFGNGQVGGGSPIGSGGAAFQGASGGFAYAGGDGLVIIDY